jgi:hypothetical protein
VAAAHSESRRCHCCYRGYMARKLHVRTCVMIMFICVHMCVMFVCICVRLYHFYVHAWGVYERVNLCAHRLARGDLWHEVICVLIGWHEVICGTR